MAPCAWQLALALLVLSAKGFRIKREQMQGVLATSSRGHAADEALPAAIALANPTASHTLPIPHVTGAGQNVFGNPHPFAETAPSGPLGTLPATLPNGYGELLTQSVDFDTSLRKEASSRREGDNQLASWLTAGITSEMADAEESEDILQLLAEHGPVWVGELLEDLEDEDASAAETKAAVAPAGAIRNGEVSQRKEVSSQPTYSILSTLKEFARESPQRRSEVLDAAAEAAGDAQYWSAKIKARDAKRKARRSEAQGNWAQARQAAEDAKRNSRENEDRKMRIEAEDAKRNAEKLQHITAEMKDVRANLDGIGELSLSIQKALASKLTASHAAKKKQLTKHREPEDAESNGSINSPTSLSLEARHMEDDSTEEELIKSYLTGNGDISAAELSDSVTNLVEKLSEKAAKMQAALADAAAVEKARAYSNEMVFDVDGNSTISAAGSRSYQLDSVIAEQSRVIAEQSDSVANLREKLSEETAELQMALAQAAAVEKARAYSNNMAPTDAAFLMSLLDEHAPVKEAAPAAETAQMMAAAEAPSQFDEHDAAVEGAALAAEFAEVMAAEPASPPLTEEELFESFKSFDVDGSSGISAAEFSDSMSNFRGKLSDKAATMQAALAAEAAEMTAASKADAEKLRMQVERLERFAELDQVDRQAAEAKVMGRLARDKLEEEAAAAKVMGHTRGGGCRGEACKRHAKLRATAGAMPSASTVKPKGYRMGDEDKPAAKVFVLPNLLTAEEATSADSSVVTVHPKKAEELGLMAGDTVRLKGKRDRETLCALQVSEKVGKGAVQLSAVTRTNLRLSLGDALKLYQCDSVKHGTSIKAPGVPAAPAAPVAPVAAAARKDVAADLEATVPAAEPHARHTLRLVPGISVIFHSFHKERFKHLEGKTGVLLERKIDGNWRVRLDGGEQLEGGENIVLANPWNLKAVPTDPLKVSANRRAEEVVLKEAALKEAELNTPRGRKSKAMQLKPEALLTYRQGTGFVSLSLGLIHVDPLRLSKNKELIDVISTTIREAVAREGGGGTFAGELQFEASIPGGGSKIPLLVLSWIQLPSMMLAELFRDKISSSETFSDSLATEVQNIAGIEAVTTGPISIAELQVPEAQATPPPYATDLLTTMMAAKKRARTHGGGADEAYILGVAALAAGALNPPPEPEEPADPANYHEVFNCPKEGASRTKPCNSFNSVFACAEEPGCEPLFEGCRPIMDSNFPSFRDSQFEGRTYDEPCSTLPKVFGRGACDSDCRCMTCPTSGDCVQIVDEMEADEEGRFWPEMLDCPHRTSSARWQPVSDIDGVD